MEGDTRILAWWAGLCLIALANVFLLYRTHRLLVQKKARYNDLLFKIRNQHFYLAAIYTLGCCFRAILPRGDLSRIVLYDSWVSSIVIGRTVATIAELCFVAQWALILYEISVFTSNKKIGLLAKLPVPIIVCAEVFSWYACTTSNYLGTVCEESLWVVAASISLYGFYLGRRYYTGAALQFLNGAMIAAVGYIIYMVTIDIPNYYISWSADQAAEKAYLSLSEGFSQLCSFWVYTRSYTDWQYELLWMPLYFGGAVWASMFIVNATRLDKTKDSQ